MRLDIYLLCLKMGLCPPGIDGYNGCGPNFNSIVMKLLEIEMFSLTLRNGPLGIVSQYLL